MIPMNSWEGKRGLFVCFQENRNYITKKRILLEQTDDSQGGEGGKHLHLSFFVFPAVVSDCSIISDRL